MLTNPLNPRILAVLPKRMTHECESTKPCDCGANGYNQALDDVISALSTLDLGVVPSNETLLSLIHDFQNNINETADEEFSNAIRHLMLNETKAGKEENNG